MVVPIAVEEAEKELPKATTEAATAADEDVDRRAAVGRTSLLTVTLATAAALVVEEPPPSEMENTGTSSDVGAGDGAPCDENASVVGVVCDR